MQTPLISIITVCYNAEQCIERTLRSVVEQSYQHIEYIVIDGASTDNTLRLVSRLAPNARVYSAPDKGIYDAMNKGIDRAVGDYLWFVNAGDALYSANTVRDIVEQIQEQEELPDIIYGDTMLIDREGNEQGLRRLRPPRQLSADSFRDGMLVCHQAFVCRRVLAPYYDLDYRFSADVDWCIRVMKSARTYLFVSSPLARYLNEGATTRNRLTSLRERFDVLRRHYGLIPTLLRHLVHFPLRLVVQKLRQLF